MKRNKAPAPVSTTPHEKPRNSSGPSSLAEILWPAACEGSEGGDLDTPPSYPGVVGELKARTWHRDRFRWAAELRPLLVKMGMSGQGLGRVWYSLATEYELAALAREVAEKPIKNRAGYFIQCLKQAGLMPSRRRS